MDKNLTYLQARFDPQRQKEQVRALHERLSPEVMLHLEFIRLTDGRHTCSSLPVVRYTTERSLGGERTHILRPRIIVYSPGLLGLMVALGAAIAVRTPIELDILRDRNALYNETSEGLIENVYQLKLINMDDKPKRFRISVTGLPRLKLVSTEGDILEVALQALFNQDNGTGRVLTLSGSGLSAMGRHLKAWYEQLPGFYTDSLSPNVVAWSFNDLPTGNPGGTDGAVFACYATPSFGMGAVPWNYGTYTWHTGRDTYDKLVFDDVKHNATLAALLTYLASEDPDFIARDKSPGEWPQNWPENCGKGARRTRPRL